MLVLVLVLVSRNVTCAHFSRCIALTLQLAVDDWAFIAPQLEDLSHHWVSAKARH